MDQVEEVLHLLKDKKERLSKLEKQRQVSYGFWSMWKFYAQNEDWFTDFIHTEWIPWDELRYSKKSDGSEFPVSREHGERLWEERQGILNGILVLKREIVEHILWLREQNVSFETIGIYYGATAGGVCHFLKENPIDSMSEVRYILSHG